MTLMRLNSAKQAGPIVSVLMPCFNPGPFLADAVKSVLSQPECLELVVVDGGSTDGSQALLAAMKARDPHRIQLLIEPDQGPADALNKALRLARGTLIGWLNADDLYPSGALARATAALDTHPEWLMVYGEGEEFDTSNFQRKRYFSLQPHVGLAGFSSHCFICQPSVVFRRSMAIMLGAFDHHWRTAFDFDYWLRAFAAFPTRIGYIPYLQGITRIHRHTITSQQRCQVALEATELLACHFGVAPVTRLQGYALELQLGIAALPPGVSMPDHLEQLFSQAEAWVAPADLALLRRDWLLDATTAPAQRAAETAAAGRQLHKRLSAQLLQLIQPHLRFDHPGPPAGPHSRLQAAADSQECLFPLLQQDGVLRALLDSRHRNPRSLLHPFGVNVIVAPGSSAEIQLWVTALCSKLQKAGVPVALQAPLADSGPYAINLICLTPPQHARWLLESGLGTHRGRLNLAAWSWIGDRWPEAWRPLLTLMDGVCSPTAAQHAALAAALASWSEPMHLEQLPSSQSLPKIVYSDMPALRHTVRLRHLLPADGVLIAINADLQQPPTLVNSFGAIEAFQQAFPLGDLRHHETARPHLLVLIEPPAATSVSTDPEWQWLKTRCDHDSHLHLCRVDGWSLQQRCQLIAACDVWLSLRRGHALPSELLTALQLRLQVIATADDTASELPASSALHLVPNRRVPIPRGTFPEAEGMLWAEPDRQKASALLRSVVRQLDQAASGPELAGRITCKPPE